MMGELIRQLLGTIVGSAFIIGIWTTFWEMYRRYSAKINDTYVLCDAIAGELKTRWDQYLNTRFAIHFEHFEAGGVLDDQYPVTQGYFSVYETNTSRIAQLQNREIRDQILKTYSEMRRFIDELKLNNNLLERFEQWKWGFSEKSSPEQKELLDIKVNKRKQQAALRQSLSAQR
jgi:hypothetical protein